MLKNLINRSKDNAPTHKVGQLGIFNPLAWLFFLGFSVPGIAITAGCGFANWNLTSRLNWIELEARVSTDAEEIADIEEADLQYSFRFEGRTYHGEGLGASSFFTDSDEQERLVRRFARNIPKKRPVSVWVNPADPEKSTLEEPQGSAAIFFMAIFAFSHGITGMGLLLFSWNARKQTRGIDQKIATHPEDILQWRSDWERGVSRFSGADTRGLWAYACIAVICTIWWTTLNTWLFPGETSLFKFLGLLFSGIGLIPFLFLIRAIRTHSISRKLNVGFPPGGLSAATDQAIIIQYQDPGSAAVIRNAKWKLVCKNVSGSQENADDDEHFEAEGRLESTGLSHSTLRFDLPPFAEKTQAPNTHYSGVSWVLTGSNGWQTGIGPFEIPVLRSESDEEN